MNEKQRYDLTIIGAGPGGYVAAIKAAQLGMSVALVEKRKSLGGTCLNIGCIPSKALLSTTEMFSQLKGQAASHGLLFENLRFDLSTIMKRKQSVVKKLTSGLAALMKNNKVAVFFGEGTVEDSRTVTVSERGDGGNGERETISSDRIIIATGSVPTELPPLPFDGEVILDSEDALAMDKVPKKLIVVGAGAIGLEMGSVWARLGTEVVFIEIMDSILPGWDRQVSSGLLRALEKQNISFLLRTKVTGFERSEEGVTITARDEKGEAMTLNGDKVLVAAGRRPYCPKQIIQALQLKTEEQGFILVNDRYEASSDGVYAIGDVIHGPMLAHKAEEEGVAVAELIAGEPGRVNYAAIPGVVYTSPEAASVGETEEQLNETNIPFKKGVFQFRANGRALASGNVEGFVKVLSHAKTDRLLGVHIVGESAGTLISEAVTVMEFEGSAEDMGRIVHAHPTLPEALKEAALAAYDKPINGI